MEGIVIGGNDHCGGCGPETSGGSGGKVRAESGMTEIRDARLTEKAIRHGWIKAPWRLNEPKSRLVERVRELGDANLRDRAMLTTYQLLESDSERARGIGVKSVTAMMGQNLAVSLKAIDKLVPDKHEVNHTANEVGQMLAELRNNDEFVAQQYSGAIPTNGHAGPHGYFGKPGPVGDGGPPPVD